MLEKNQWSIYRTHFFCLVHIQRWGCGIRHQFFYAHNIFSSVIIFLLDFIGGTKALWYCDILTHICSWFTYFFFHSFSYHKSGITLSNILFFLLTLFRKERKKNKGKHFLSTEFSSFLYVYHIDSLALHTLHMFTLLTFGQPFMKFSVYDFFVDFFLFLNFSFHYRLFFLID